MSSARKRRTKATNTNQKPNQGQQADRTSNSEPPDGQAPAEETPVDGASDDQEPDDQEPDDQETSEELSEDRASNGTKSGRDYTQRSVVRVCSILTMLQNEGDGVTLNQVVDATGLAKPSAFRYMWTLQQQRYVERVSGTNVYRLGLGFAGLQSRQLEVLRERARPWLEALREEFDETTNLGLLDNFEVLYVDVVESPQAVRLSASAGQRSPLHSTALGKAIAVKLPEQQVRDIMDHSGLPPVTGNTIAKVDDYLHELSYVHKHGYAIDDGENHEDGRCVAAPLLGTRLPAAISISAPTYRCTKRQLSAYGRRLVEVAKNIAPQ